MFIHTGDQKNAQNDYSNLTHVIKLLRGQVVFELVRLLQNILTSMHVLKITLDDSQ